MSNINKVNFEVIFLLRIFKMFLLNDRGNILYLFADGLKNPKFAIDLSNSCRSCSRTIDSGRPHTFQISIEDEDGDSRGKSSCFYEEKSIKSKLFKQETKKLLSEIRQKFSQLLTFNSSFDEGCVLEFAAANESELNEWLRLIVQASCGVSSISFKTVICLIFSKILVPFSGFRRRCKQR